MYEGVDTAHSSPTRDYELNSAPTASYTCFSGTQGQPNGANREAYGRWSDGGQLRNLTKEEIARPWPGPGPSSWLFAGFARSFGSRSRSQSPPGSPPGSRSLSPRPLAHDPSRARDLGELQRIVERDAEAWAREGRLKELITAFSLAAKVGPDERRARKDACQTSGCKPLRSKVCQRWRPASSTDVYLLSRSFAAARSSLPRLPPAAPMQPPSSAAP